jgi:hypothetical protein
MPWRLRKLIALILFGAAILALAIVVFVIAKGVAFDLLAVIALLGGAAIIVNSLPDNGTGER